MAYLFLAALFVSAVAVISAETGGSTCQVNQQEIQKDLYKCMIKYPALIFAVVKNSQSVLSMDFVCNNIETMVGMMMCMEDEMLSCYPKMKAVLLKVLPGENRWTEALQLMCDHKSDLNNDCMDQNQLQQVMNCYMSQIASVTEQMDSEQDIKAATCRIIQYEEQCFQANRGACSKTTSDLVIQMFTRLFPDCPPAVDPQVEKNPFAHFLLKGEPLKFNPQGTVKRN